MRIALDTNAYVAYFRSDPEIVQRVQESELVFLPFVVLGELRGGFLGGRQSEQNERHLAEFLNSPRVEPLFADEQTTHHFARLYLQLRKQGTPIPMNDLWIAALVVQHDLMLVARDRHFDHLPQLLRA